MAALAAAALVTGCATQDNGTEVDGVIVVTGSPATPGEVPPPSPPPPPPPPPPMPEMAGDEVIVTGSRIKRSDYGIKAPIDAVTSDRVGALSTSLPKPLPPEPRPDQPEPQAGMLTAGDYDDVLNPQLYKDYLDKMLQGELKDKKLPYVDANQRIGIKVLDRLGKPVPLAKVSLKAADGSPMFPLRTGADGMTYIYPKYDALGAGMTVSVSSDGARTLSQTVSAARLKEGGELVFDLSKDAGPAAKLDLLLTLDATGSMTDEMAYLQVELTSILGRLQAANSNLDIRAGLIVYRDEGDAYITKMSDFTGDMDAFKADLGAQNADGGGDMPEAMQTAMRDGLGLEWRDDAIKINLLVADAPPHDADIASTWDSALISRSRGVHIVPLAASGVDKTAEFLMRGMAQMTGGRYMFLTDDSGIGNPHAEPTVDCYVVTRLDSLVQRVLEALLTGQRVEPDGKEVIRTVGNYRAGVCAPELEKVG